MRQAVVDGVVETAASLPHIAWAARNARRVLGLRRVRGSTLVLEFSARLEYQPLGVIGAIGPWNYPVAAICSLAAYALAAGNAMVYKPSEYTPGVSQWLADRFAEVVPEQPVLQVVHGLGDSGAALCRSGVDKIAFIGSTATAKKVMAACAETLTPLAAECGGKDAMIVAAMPTWTPLPMPPSGAVCATRARPASASNASMSRRRSPTSSSSGSSPGHRS